MFEHMGMKHWDGRAWSNFNVNVNACIIYSAV